MAPASIFRRALLPSAEENQGPLKIDSVARARVGFTLVAILFDVGLFVLLRDSPRLHQSVLFRFVVINITLLLLDAALSWMLLRRARRFHRGIQTVCVLLETLTVIVWVQVTGTVSSYFLVVLPFGVVMYRLLVDHRMGLVTLAAAIVFHATAVGLEELDVLRTASLFVEDPGGVYAWTAFRIAATISLDLVLVVSFAVANVVAVTLYDKDVALGAAHRDLERAEAEARPGRLCGMQLAGRYVLGELLGRGGMGEVYQAQRVSDGGEVAVKVLYAHLTCEPDALERFKREAEALRRLPPEHVAAHIESGATDDGLHYLVMERLRGEDLGALLRRVTRLPIAELLPLVDGLAAALGAAHAVGIVHRDLKPQNVFLVGPRSSEVRLLDFGIARLLDGGGQTLTQHVLGTPGYLSPEQAGGGPIGPAVDVFALGALVYRALTGQSAFASRDPAGAVYEARHVDPVPPSRWVPDLGADVDAVIAVALAKQPALRYATPAELAVDLRAAVSGRLGEATRLRAAALASTAATVATVATITGTLG